jgi:putative transposase
VDCRRGLWLQITVQTCIIHLIRNTFRLGFKRDWDALKRDVRPICTAVNAHRGPGCAVRAGGEVVAAVRGDHPAVGERVGGVHPVPGLRPRDPDRHLLYQRDRVAERPLPAGGQGQRPFPHRAGGAKVPLPGHPVLDPTGTGQARWAVRWKPALYAFATTFADRFPAAEAY